MGETFYHENEYGQAWYFSKPVEIRPERFEEAKRLFMAELIAAAADPNLYDDKRKSKYLHTIPNLYNHRATYIVHMVSRAVAIKMFPYYMYSAHDSVRKEMIQEFLREEIAGSILRSLLDEENERAEKKRKREAMKEKTAVTSESSTIDREIDKRLYLFGALVVASAIADFTIRLVQLLSQ